MAVDSRPIELSFDLGHIEQLAVAILRDWLAADPTRNRGAGEYYLDRLSRGKMLVPNELAIAEYLDRHFDASRAYAIEMGTGYGELSLLVALKGFEVTAFESDQARYAGASALLAGLTQAGVDLGGMSLRLGTFPVALDLALVDRGESAIFISSNVTSSHVMEHIDGIHRSLRLFDHLVVDLARFGTKRDRESIQTVAAEFEGNGFMEIARIYSSDDNDIRHFERRVAAHLPGTMAIQSAASVDDPEEEVPAEFGTELQWTESLDRLLVPVLQHRIERHGSASIGAYAFYAARLQSGRLLQDYEVAVARELLRRRFGVTHVDEVGSGFGELVFLLGWNGFNVRGFEADPARARTARRLREVLDVTDSARTRRVQLIEENFPSPQVPPPKGRSLILTTNLVATRSSEQQADVVRAMRHYSFALVDVQRFFDKRDDEAAQEVVAAMFAKAGFVDWELFLDLGVNGRYLLFSTER